MDEFLDLCIDMMKIFCRVAIETLLSMTLDYWILRYDSTANYLLILNESKPRVSASLLVVLVQKNIEPKACLNLC